MCGLRRRIRSSDRVGPFINKRQQERGIYFSRVQYSTGGDKELKARAPSSHDLGLQLWSRSCCSFPLDYMTTADTRQDEPRRRA